MFLSFFCILLEADTYISVHVCVPLYGRYLMLLCSEIIY